MTPAQIAAMVADREAGTPGPWRYDGPVWNQIVWTDSENRLCFMAHSSGLDDARDKANARRIARVPAMEAEILRLRAALTDCLSSLEAYCAHMASAEPERAQARAALKGGTP